MWSSDQFKYYVYIIERVGTAYIYVALKAAMFRKYCVPLFVTFSLIATGCAAVDCQDGYLGVFPAYPASSCRDIHSCYPNSTTGYYWIWDGPFSIHRQYCNMDEMRCGVLGGWMRVAHVNMTDRHHKCPRPLRTYTFPRRMCARYTRCTLCTYIHIMHMRGIQLQIHN